MHYPCCARTHSRTHSTLTHAHLKPSSQGIGSLLNLKVLDLSCNRLQSVGGLEGLTALERLVLAYNSITSLAGIKAVAGPAYSLQELDLVDNLVSEIRVLHSYLSPHASRFPFLHTLSSPAHLLVPSLPVIAHWAVCVHRAQNGRAGQCLKCFLTSCDSNCERWRVVYI